MRHSIERTILSSIIEHSFVGENIDIRRAWLDPEIFIDDTHKEIAEELNKMASSGEPICADTLMLWLKKSGKLGDMMATEIYNILAATPAGSKKFFDDLLGVLKREAQNDKKRMLAYV